ncbi:putative anaphase-promoting complex subunit ApcB [Mariannaea sp. PMI_226]|nr:putative anaphase-promoting complex subunit ApcB [Mariannaea sp. PMI_226]
MTASRYHARKQRIFKSVFQTDVSQPTPRSTPIAAFTQPGIPFGGPLPHAPSLLTPPQPPPPPPHHATALHHASDQVRWDRAWHAVTSRIQLPSSVAVEDSFGTLAPESQELDYLDLDFQQSLSLVLNPARTLPQASQTEDILLWHTQQVRQHFVHHVMPLLAACASQGTPTQILVASISTLEAAHRQYLYGLRLIARGIREEAASVATDKFLRDLHAIIGNSMSQGLLDALRIVIHQLVRLILGSKRRSEENLIPLDLEDDERVSTARGELLGLVESLQNVGMAGQNFQIQFAEIMNATMAELIQNSYAGVWKTTELPSATPSVVTSGCLSHLSDWVENHYGRLAVEVFNRLGVQIAWSDVECWKEIAVSRLATLRIQELFDIALKWPESKGGLEDLRLAVTTPQHRLQLTDAFSVALQKRLLHPGRSTLEILQTYISMIRTFHALDPSKVLLDRVVSALQLYLCQRDDAIRIVVTGLLSNPDALGTEEGKTRLVELAVLLNSSAQQRRQIDDEDLDWSDMTWVPDPSDAGVNYKRPKNEDVIGTLINALGSQDIFIKEFQLIIAERLLSNQTSFVQETKVLGLLKKRFGESALQNCDVMMKDIQDSKRVDTVLRKNIQRESNPGSEKVTYHSKILSRLFWPSLPKETFIVPPPVAEIQRRYEQGFEELKSSRKLTWLDNLGTANVKLDLEDRSIELECKTYEAAVIYAFHDNDSSGNSGPPQRTFNEIWSELQIDEDLLELALRFWVNKRVIREIGDQTYVVLERLDDNKDANETETASVAQVAEDGGQSSPRKTKNVDNKEKEQRTVYWQFIVGMLTNSAPAMPLGQILMMMKMLIADGCSWSNEELQEFLAEKIAEGGLELAGGKYRLPKK